LFGILIGLNLVQSQRNQEGMQGVQKQETFGCFLLFKLQFTSSSFSRFNSLAPDDANKATCAQ